MPRGRVFAVGAAPRRCVTTAPGEQKPRCGSRVDAAEGESLDYRLSLLSIFVRKDDMSETIPTHTVKRGDAVALWFFMIAGVGIAVWAGWSAVARIIQVLPNRDVSVLGEFAGTKADAPIGVDGAPIAVELDRALIT